MIIKNLYRYTRDDGSTAVSLNPPTDGREFETAPPWRLIADDGKILVSGLNRTYCVDTNEKDLWHEEEEEEDIDIT